jgi:hypothetical protein
MAVTVPVLPIVATDGLALVQVPPVVVVARFVVDATQTLSPPVMAAGVALIVIVVTVLPPPLIV